MLLRASRTENTDLWPLSATKAKITYSAVQMYLVVTLYEAEVPTFL